GFPKFGWFSTLIASNRISNSFDSVNIASARIWDPLQTLKVCNAARCTCFFDFPDVLGKWNDEIGKVICIWQKLALAAIPLSIETSEVDTARIHGSRTFNSLSFREKVGAEYYRSEKSVNVFGRFLDIGKLTRSDGGYRAQTNLPL